MPDLDPRSTALVLIDLQQGILAMPVAPRSGADVLATGKSLAERFRGVGAPVVLVRVAFADDYADAPRQRVDQPMPLPAGGLPPAWTTLADGLARPGDILITKRQWGAFHGTELDLQLRRRGVRTIVLGGVSTNAGVESTARFAWELGYELVLVEDACASASAEMHEMAFRATFPRISHVARSEDVVFSAAA